MIEDILKKCKKCGKPLASDSTSEYCINCDAKIGVKLKKICEGVGLTCLAAVVGLGLYNYKKENNQDGEINSDSGGIDPNNTDYNDIVNIPEIEDDQVYEEPPSDFDF